MSKRSVSPRPSQRRSAKRVQSERLLSERVQAAVRAENLAQVVDGLNIGIALTTQDGEIVYANPRFGQVLGVPEGALVPGEKLTRFVAPSSAPGLRLALHAAQRGPAEGDLNVGAEAFGDERIVRLSLAPLDRDKHSLIRIVAVETTQLVRAKQALENSEASLQNLSARLLHVQDEERRRLARDLHDTTGQEIAFVLISLGRVAKEIEKVSPETREALAESVRWIRKIEAEIRTLSYLLHPPLLDETGLAAALEWFVEGFKKRTGIQLTLEVEPGFPRLSSESETALFRVVQESLSNVLRHSGSPSARVWLTKTLRQVRVSIEDEGRGFPKNDANPGAAGVGIQGMIGRLEPLGGNLNVSTSPTGTTVAATVPFSVRTDAPSAMPDVEEPDVEGRPERHGNRKRILIADDHDVARRGIRSILATQPDLEVCGEAFDGDDAVRKTAELRPDLVILDLSMPGGGGALAAMKISKMAVDTKVLLYSSYVAKTLEHAIRRIPCDGYVPKSNASEDLIRAIYIILAGGSFFGNMAEQAATA